MFDRMVDTSSFEVELQANVGEILLTLSSLTKVPQLGADDTYDMPTKLKVCDSLDAGVHVVMSFRQENKHRCRISRHSFEVILQLLLPRGSDVGNPRNDMMYDFNISQAQRI